VKSADKVAALQNKADTASQITFDDISGTWEILSYNSFIPPRFNGSGRLAAALTFSEYEGFYSVGYSIGCNGIGHKININKNGKLTKPPKEYAISTHMGCPGDLQARDEAITKFMTTEPNLTKHSEYELSLVNGDEKIVAQRADYRRKKLAIRDFEEIKGQWRVIMLNKAGLGLGGSFYAPDIVTINDTHIQYGNHTHYIQNPKIESDGKITGEITGNILGQDCDSSRRLFENNDTDFTHISDANALCFLFDTITGTPLAEHMYSNTIQLVSGQYRIVLERIS